MFEPRSSAVSLTIFVSILVLCGCCCSVPALSDDSDSVIRLYSSDDDVEASPCVKTSMPSSCPVKCFRTDPVCGVDGVTYWCGCSEAMCAVTKIAKMGFCEVRNGGSSGQALLLVHILWLILLGLALLFGAF